MSQTIGLSIGKFIGNAAAYGVHGAVSAAQYTGRFGQDVAAGATEQYSVKSAELAAKRAEIAAERGVVAMPVATKQRKVAVRG